jgi:hypothetical protein
MNELYERPKFIVGDSGEQANADDDVDLYWLSARRARW